MDPLSITLTAVTLATAVKDMAELAQKLRESFTNVSKNFRSAQRVADNIREMVAEIKDFCEAHRGTLANMKDFLESMQALLNKFRSFETSIIPLLQKMGRQRLGSFIRGWWNNNKIQECILDLESEIVKVMREYMMRTTMRTEVKLEIIHQETSRGITGLAQGLEVVRRDVCALRSTTAATNMTNYPYESSGPGTTSDDFNHNVVMFANSTPSTSAPMLRTPTVITEELMTAAYIKLQINRIAMTVEKISTLPTSSPPSIAKFCVSPTVEHLSMRITNLRRHVVRQVTSICDLLDTKLQAISINYGASALNNLSDDLATLYMGHESILVGNWAITLVRRLVDSSNSEQPDLAATLALHLFSQSIRYRDSGDNVQSLHVIEEAYTITQDLRNQYSKEVHFQILYSNILLQYAHLVDNRRSIELCAEALQILEGMLGVQAFSQSGFKKVVQPSDSFFGRLFSSTLPITAITSYAQALQQLGTYSFIDGHPESAHYLVLLAVAVRRKIVSIHGDAYKVDLATALSSLARGRAARRISAAERLRMADECIPLLRGLAEQNPPFYARWLVSVLWAKASMLGRVDRDAEAIGVWEEVTSLAGQIVQDSKLCAIAFGNLSHEFRRLKMYNDAVRTEKLAITTYQHADETQAAKYFHLSKDLRQLRRYKESAEAARTSVALYRRLAMKESEIWLGELTEGLSDLAHCLAALGDYSEALIAWKESVTMLVSFLDTYVHESSTVTRNYLATLENHLSLSCTLVDHEQCLTVSSTAVQRLRQLSEAYPEDTDIILYLLHAEYSYAYNMLRVGCLQAAKQYIDHWFDVWSSREKIVSDCETGKWQASMTCLKADVLDAQGCTEQALLAIQTAYRITRQLINIGTYQASSEEMIASMTHEARFRASLGDSAGAQRVAEEALRLSRDGEITANSVVISLHCVALTALSSRNYIRAVEAAREGCAITATSDWQNNEEEERDILLRPSLFAVLSSAEANLGQCNTALEHANRAIDASLDIMHRKADVSATTAEQSFIEIRGNLAEILLATGDITQARQICEERRAYFSERVETRIGEYREFAPVLRMLGILCCGEGRHEEGGAAAQELSRIMKTLGSTFPSLQEQVKIRLRRQTRVPILKILEEMNRKLDCGHQKEVISLFTV